MGKVKTLKGYICGTDTLDISLGANDIKIFSSVKALKKARTCWDECGILEIDLSNAKLIKKPMPLKKLITKLSK